MTESGKILDGVRVLDLSTFVTGGFCSLMLANQGADVVKIEQPGYGDDNRHSGPPFIDGESPYFWTVNYGKRSVELDLKTEAGREALYDLVAEADVFLQNYRPGADERLGVDDRTIREHNERVIYCSISAFGETGPWSQRPGYDLLVQGLSGIMSVTGEPDGEPVKVGLPQTDLITAMWAAFGIVNALYRRERTGEGDSLELGMLDAALPWLTKQAGKAFAGETPKPMGTRDPVLAPYQKFATADGYITVAALNQKLWRGLCETLDRADLLEDARFETNADRVEHMDALEAELTATFERRPSDEWIDRLSDAGVPVANLHDVDEALDNEQVRARGVVTETDRDGTDIPVIEHPINYERSDAGFERPPPKLGEHNRAVFRDLGYDEEQVDDLAARGAFGDTDGE